LERIATIKDRAGADNFSPVAVPAGPVRARALVEAHGRSSLDHFKTLPDRSIFFSPDGRAFIAYRFTLGVAVALGDPVGPPDAVPRIIGEFCARFERGLRGVAFVQTGEEFLDAYRAAGLSPVRVGAAAIVNLGAFDLSEARAKPLRSALRKADRAGLRIRHLEPPLPASLIAALRETNEAWKTIPGRFERGFTVGRFEEEQVRRSLVSLIESLDERIEAFVNWVPSYVPGEATVDLIRRRPDAPNGALDALVTRVLARARARGFSRFDLGFVPLADLDHGPIAHPAERFLRWLRASSGLSERQRAIEAWKAKFNPRWEPRWLVYRGGPIAFARVAWAVRRIAAAAAAWRDGVAPSRNHGSPISPGRAALLRGLGGRAAGEPGLPRPDGVGPSQIIP